MLFSVNSTVTIAINKIFYFTSSVRRELIPYLNLHHLPESTALTSLSLESSLKSGEMKNWENLKINEYIKSYLLKAPAPNA